MTFIDVSQGRPSSGLIAGYSILCAVSVFCTAWAVNLGRSRLHYRSFFSVRVLFPLALFIMALENAALAASGRIYDTYIEEDGNENYDTNLFIKAIFVLQTFEVPILLVVFFEITYLVHKRRSVNFCGMYFDEGRRINNTAAMSCMLRNSIRTLATLLLVMGLIVNFDLIQSGAPVDELAGRAGWWALRGEDWDGKLHLLLSLIPTAILILVSFYLSIMLWRYGTESAMVVHSSMCNMWHASFFGTLAMAVGQLFREELYTVMSNAGMLIFVITVLLVMAEIDKDIVSTNDVACFLVQVAQKGDQIRVNPVPSPSTQPIHEHPFVDEEEKRPDGEGNRTINNVANVEAEEHDIEAPADNPVPDRSLDKEQTDNALRIGQATNTGSDQVVSENEGIELSVPPDQNADTQCDTSDQSMKEKVDLEIAEKSSQVEGGVEDNGGGEAAQLPAANNE